MTKHKPGSLCHRLKAGQSQKGKAMCAINPKRQRHFTVSVYTSATLTDEQWDEMVADKLLHVEIWLNEDMMLRWHIKDRHE